MYAQLGAIAREFNFPSTTGICIYMHVNESGSLLAPRISEESWNILWGHLFEPNAPSPTSGIPICGRIEFDIGRFRNGFPSPVLADTVCRCCESSVVSLLDLGVSAGNRVLSVSVTHSRCFHASTPRE